MKPKVIFIHILKTAGTSMLYMLYKEYGVELFHPVPISTVQGLVGYPALRGVTALDWQHRLNLDTADQYGVIAGHYDWTLAERLPHWTVLVLLRHPVEQLRSLYQYMVRSAGELGNTALWMQGIGFRHWIQHDHARNYLNCQTTYLSGHFVRDVDLALRNLFSERVLYGFVEHFDESIERFNDRLGLSLQPQRHHISPNVIELSPETCALAERLQAEDMRLYRAAYAAWGQ